MYLYGPLRLLARHLEGYVVGVNLMHEWLVGLYQDFGPVDEGVSHEAFGLVRLVVAQLSELQRRVLLPHDSGTSRLMPQVPHAWL